MTFKEKTARFFHAATAHDAVLCVVCCVFFIGCTGFIVVASDLFGNTVPASVCTTSTTVFTTFAADQPCQG
jgi:hypothetical protein